MTFFHSSDAQAKVFEGRRSPHPAAVDFVHSRLVLCAGVVGGDT